MGQLTDLQIKNAEPREKEYFLADGDGLYLRIRQTRKVWHYRYKRDGKEIKLGLGRYPVVSLAAARRKAREETTRQYPRLVHRWVASIGLDDTAYGTHTMRRTKASLIYRRTKNLRAVQPLLGHTKLASAVRYLGIEVDDALEMAKQTEV